MALVLKDRVQETTTTSGTGTLTLAGAVSGFDTFSASIGNGNVTYYTIFDNTAYTWEVGIGTVGAGTLARTTVLSNSSGTTSPISLAGNTAFVFCTYPAEKSINYDTNDVATIGETLGYSDSGIIASFASTVAGYNQVVLQNKSTATNASTNFNVSNDAGTAGSNYAELGINSSTFTGTGSFNIAGASYVASASTDLTLGTYGAYSIHFVTNSSTTDAMTIFNNGGISLGGFTNPGIGNMAASKFVPGYTSVTAAAGTTVLTASSNYYQNLVGTTTQTFQLPDATGLLVGTTFIFDNDSTGTLTVVDNASGPIDTIPGGALGYVYLANNSTVAGTWRRHAFLPASYDFNSTTANFGNATITNAVWNGTTIASGYGGTGLTTFTGANNALYSTNATTLVAGTLPIAAGGTAKTTFTANGVVYGDGTNPLGVTAAGTTGQVLIGNTGGAPSWATVSSSLVSSFSAGTTGFTPNSATTGAVTLAGTLGVANGGTGTSTTFTTGSVVFSGASGVYSQDNAQFFWDDTNNRLGIGTSAPSQKVTISSNTVLPSAGAPLTSNIWSVGANSTPNTTSFDSFASQTNITTRRANGTAASPTALVSGDLIFQFAARGYGATGYSSARAQFTFNAAENWTDTAQGAYIAFNTAQIGTTSLTEKMRILDSGAISFGSSGTAYGTSGQVLTSNGNATPTWTSLSSSAVTSFSAGTTGFTPNSATTGAVTLAGTLNVANGGTGQTTATAAFDALNPMTTVGDMIYEGTGPTATRLPIGTSGQILTVSGGIPSWQNAPASGVTSFETSLSGLTPSTATTGVVTLAGTLGVASGGTGQTTYTNGELLIGNTTGNTLTKATLTQGTGITITNGAGAITVANAGVTSFSAGTTGLTPSTGTTGAVTLAGTLAVANGGTGATTAPNARTNLGATTVGGNLFTLTNPSAVTFPRFNADNTVSALDAATFRTAIGAGTGNGTVTSVAALTLGTTGTDLSSTVATGTTTPVITLNVPTASATNRGALSSTDWTTFNNKGNGTVTSVGWTGGIVSVATATTTPAFTIAGTSGGIPYFSSASTWASSAALAANALVIGGGAGAAPATTTTGTGVVTALGIAVDSGSGGLVTNTGTATLTNKRVNPRSLAVANTSGTVTPNSDSFDQVNYALTGTSTFAVPSGTPVNGQRLSIRLAAVSTQSISFTTTSGGYRIIGTTLPSSVPSGKTIYIGCIYNSTDLFWDVVAVSVQA